MTSTTTSPSKPASKPSFVYVTYIRATPQQVWDALRDPKMTEAYWFGRHNVSDWKVGSRWEHRVAGQDNRVDLVGEILESDPPHRLVFTWADTADHGKPEQTSQVTYELTAFGETTCLTVRHENLNPDMKMFNGISKGWPAVLANLKSYLETGKAMEMPKACG